MIKSPEILQQIVQNIAGGMLCYSDAARKAGASPATFWRWMKSSSTGDAEFIIEFMDEKVQFADAVKNARKLAIIELEGKFLSRVAHGYEEVLTYQGRIQYKERPELIGLDDDVVRILGYQHRWQTDPTTGEPIPLTVHRDVAIAATIKILESHFSIYRPRSDLNVNQRLSGGVTVVDPRKPKPMPIPVPVQQIAPPIDEPIIEETADDDDDVSENDNPDLDLSDILGDEPSADVAPVEMASEPEPEPIPAVQHAELPELSPLEIDLLARLRAGVKQPRPSAIVNTGYASSRADDPPERIGA